MMDDANRDKAVKVFTRAALQREYGMDMTFDTGHDYLDALALVTLKSLFDRIDESGFCHTSYGEENGVRCYGVTHYSRDTAEAARVIAMAGKPNLALKILAFTLDHIPRDNYHIPHVYHRDGSVKANTIQMDTPALVVIALADCYRYGGDAAEIERLYAILKKRMEDAWGHHYHPDYQLFDAGNYNEQLDGGDKPILDMFTNSAMVAAWSELSGLAAVFDAASYVGEYQSRSCMIAQGIERNLYDDVSGTYRIGYDLSSKTYDNTTTWLKLYPARWYRGRPEAWRNAYHELRDKASFLWQDKKIITGESGDMQFRLVGKVFSMMLGFMAENSLADDFSHHWRFMTETIVHPRYLFPETWLVKDYPASLPYWKGFSEIHAGVWTPLNPEGRGDWTVDSGNCEQCSVFLQHLFHDLLGLRPEAGKIRLRPALLQYSPSVKVTDMAIRQHDGNRGKLSYDFAMGQDHTDINILKTGKLPLTVELPGQQKSSGLKELIPSMPGVDNVNQSADRICFDLSETTETFSARVEIC